jgi:hypothetical protein
MNKILINTAAALTLIIGGSCLAAPKPPAKQKADASTCSSLTKQFDDAMGTHGNAAKFSEAKTLRAEGEKDCTAGEFAKGAHDLRHALRDLGVKPARVAKSTSK